MDDPGFEQRALSETLAQFHAGVLHDADFEAFQFFPPARVSTIFDVGANRGQSIVSLRAAFPTASIHAFEANPMFFSVLEALRAHLPGELRVHSYGLASAVGTLRFYIPWVGDDPYLEESSTRLDYFERPWVVDKYRDRGTLRLEEVMVDVRAGDSLGLEPDLMKIDVEGAELDVLTGLRATIEASTPDLLVENSDWHNVTAFLRDLGYEPYRWETEVRALMPFHGATTNTFYLHSARLAGLPLR